MARTAQKTAQTQLKGLRFCVGYAIMIKRMWKRYD